MQPTARPRFRTDLVAEPVEEGGHRYIDIVDPDTGNGFRFYDVEYSLACAMDGERDIEGLVVWAKEELGIEPSSNELATVISTLGDLGYLDNAAVGAGETELAPGVYSAPRADAHAPVEDVELGYGGGASHAQEDVAMPRAEFELGTSGPGAAASMRGASGRPSAPVDGPELGASGAPREMVMEFEAPTPPPAEMPYASMRPSTRPDAEDDGPTNLPNPATSADFDDDEVSVDLSDHLAISASDVKEAVRASKVMKAVELPADLQAQLDAADAQSASAREVAERAAAERAAEAERQAEAQRQAEERAAAERAAAERLQAEAMRPPVELPRPPVGVTRPRTPTPRPVEKTPPPAVVAKEPTPAPSGGGALRLVLLVVLLLAAGLAYYWFGYREKPLPWASKSDDTAAEAQPPGPATGANPATGAVQPPPQQPPPPPAPTATLTESAPPPSDVPAGQAGIVEFVAEEGSTVSEGDPLVRFKGNPAWAQKLVGLDYDIDIRVPKQIADATKARDAAQANGNPAQVKRHQATIDERTKRLASKVTERQEIRDGQNALTVKSPATGVVTMKIAKNARAKADQIVATVTPASVLSASFTIPPGGKTPAPDASVRIAVKATPEQKANCTVTAAEGVQVTVTCPADAGIPAGTEVVLEP